MIEVDIQVVRFGKPETFFHRVPDASQEALETALDHFEGQVGTVLAINEKATQKPLWRRRVVRPS